MVTCSTPLSPLELREKVILARGRYNQGEITQEELYLAVDAYITALRAYKKRTGKQLSIPSRAYLLRAL